MLVNGSIPRIGKSLARKLAFMGSISRAENQLSAHGAGCLMTAEVPVDGSKSGEAGELQRKAPEVVRTKPGCP